MFRVLNNWGSGRKLDAYRVYLLLEGGQSLLLGLIFTVNIYYHANIVGLDALQIILVGTALELTILLFEVPTGIVADTYSRRLSILIGVGLIGVGFMVEALFASFTGILLAQVIWGVGYTFTSGATQAWITDEIGEQRAARAFLRASQVGTIAGLTGVGLSVLVGSYNVQVAVFSGGVLLVALALLLAAVMPETGFKRTAPENREGLRQMLITLRAGVRLVRLRPVLLTILLIALFRGLYSEAYDRLWIFILEDNYALSPALYNGGTAAQAVMPVYWLGVISIASALLSLLASEVILRRLKLDNHARVTRLLLLVNFALLLGIAVFSVSQLFALSIVLLILNSVLRRIDGPLYSAWLNAHVQPEVRATLFSMTGQADAIGQVGGGPLMGLIGQQFSPRHAVFAASLTFAPLLLLYVRGRQQLNTSDTPLQAAPDAALAAATESRD